MQDPATSPEGSLPSPGDTPPPPPPPAPSFESDPVGMGNLAGPSPETVNPSSVPQPNPNPVLSAPPLPEPEPVAPPADLTVPEPPLTVPDLPPPPPPSQFGGVNDVPNVAAGTGVTTATILPVGPGGPDLVSYSSGAGRRKFLLPAVIGLLLLLVLAGAAFVFFRQSAESPTTTDNQATSTEPTPTEEEVVEDETVDALATTQYASTEFNFTMDYPEEWERKDQVNGNIVVFTDPGTASLPSKVSVYSEQTTDTATVYAQSLQKLYTQLYTNWTNVNTTPTTVDTNQAIQIESTYSKGANNMAVMQLITVKGGRSFVITAEAEETAFEALRSTYTQILASLKFTN